MILLSLFLSGNGCKKSPQYNDPFDAHCIEAANALNRDDAKTLRKQLVNGVNPDLKLLDGNSLLYCAASVGAVECIKTLIEYGADINIQSNEGTALHIVAANYSDNKEAAAKLLIDAGIDVSIKNASGFTALDNARANNSTEIASIIENRMKQLGVEITDSFTEISSTPDVSIKSIRGDGLYFCSFTSDERFFGRNATLLDIITFIPNSPEWVFEIENLPEDKLWVEVKKKPIVREQNWLILKNAFEETFGLEFVLEKRQVDLLALSVNPERKITISSSIGNGEFNYGYTEKGIQLRNCSMDDLCTFLSKQFEVEIVNQTGILEKFDLNLDYDPLILKENLDDYGFILLETKEDREGLVVKKVN